VLNETGVRGSTGAPSTREFKPLILVQAQSTMPL
jgi:hypothetical protein